MTSLFHIIRDHWFKLAIIGIIGLFLLKKDFSFQFNVHDRQTKEKQDDEARGRTVQTASKDDDEILGFLNLNGLLSSGKSLAEAFEEIPKANKVTFVKRFGKVARNEQEKFNIPASVILAEAMIQSSVGTRDLAVAQQNFFAVPCGKYWKGETHNKDGMCYRIYASAWESFRDHSIFLSRSLEAPQKRDYKLWIAAISEAFATKEEYAQLLTQVIEKYDLYLLDK